MKTFTKIIFLVIVLFSHLSSAQKKYNKENMVLSNFTVQIDSIYGVEPTQDVYDDFYMRLEEVLEDTANVTIQPISTLKDNLKGIVLGNFGYPQVKGKRAAKSKSGNSYIKIKVWLTTIGMMSESNDQIGSEGLSFQSNVKKVKLRAITSITIFNGLGAKVLDFKEQAVTNEKIAFTNKSFDLDGLFISKADDAVDDNMAVFEKLLTDSFVMAANRLN